MAATPKVSQNMSGVKAPRSVAARNGRREARRGDAAYSRARSMVALTVFRTGSSGAVCKFQPEYYVMSELWISPTKS